MNLEPLVLLFTISLYHVLQPTDVSAWGDKFHVHLVNHLPDNTNVLRTHVFSGDDELGYHDLRVNDEFEWHFKTIHAGVTAFYGHFWWGSKQQGFAVYEDSKVEHHCDTVKFKCFWFFREDGIYLANSSDPKFELTKKMHDWQ